MIKIFGHKSPDTDAVCSALIWAWYLTDHGQEASAFVLGKPNTEAAFVLKRWGFEVPSLLDTLSKDDRVIVVDTNNPAELPDDINEADIIEIIDHHLLTGGLKTKEPINITIKPVASTATIMAGMMGQDVSKAPREIKGLILSCILSDTLEFRSPTTTDSDRDLARKLATDLNIDCSTYAGEMFAAKSDVSAFSDSELLRMDSKKYALDDINFRVSVLETTNPDMILARKNNLMQTMDKVAREDNVDHILLFVVDILNQHATLLIPNDLVARVAQQSFKVSIKGDSVVLPGVVSRKKQIIPCLTL